MNTKESITKAYDRAAAVLLEVKRVLKRDGVFLFSFHIFDIE